ncbi:hypothetical protein V6N12_066957 [Hibiscus sabdariffa]|uniref:RNase H type-1 domain-containing protein n=1 Tax=Hibiscus sabdariffa TaxID=183260 RepID=A0ABR2AUU9_9ROSI
MESWEEFCQLPTKDWILANLSNPSKFVANVPKWELLFAYLFWNIWKRQNERVFDLVLIHQETILQQSIRMVEVGTSPTSILHVVGNQLPARPHRDVCWSKPPSDCLEAFNLIMKPSTSGGCSMLIPYIMELLARTWNVRVTHVVRERNVLADSIVKLVLHDDFIVHRFFEPPVSCVRVLLMDAATGGLLDNG